ncbi:MAG TPA: ADOP family duplicated permease [Vicinamibacterales bacterium]|nr:ADOP family duplicated permease [Vicinamibacterales bacterium]
MRSLAAEFRHACRALAAARGFTVATVAILALGTTLSITSLVVLKAYLLTDLPYPAADRLHWIRYDAPGQPGPRGLEALDWRALDDVLEHQVAWDLDMFYVLGGEHAEAVRGAWVTPGFMQGLGVAPAMGRTLEPDAFDEGAPNVALISHRFWMRRFGGDPAVQGRTFTAYVSDRPHEAERFTVVGVLPERFWHINGFTDIFVPLRAATYPYMARLRPGVTATEAAGRIRALVTAGAGEVPPGWSPQVIPAHEVHVAQVRPVLRAVGIAAFVVLLVACANAAGLLLVRAARRQREIAVRSALGASTVALARMLVVEAVVLVGVATALALATTHLVVSSLVPTLQQQLGRPAPGGADAFAIDARVLALAVAVGLLTVAICSLAPLAAVVRGRMLPALQSGGRGATDTRRSRRARSLLIAIEIAASLVLVTGSTLMLRSVATMLGTGLGFRSERVLTASLTLRQNRYPDAAARADVFDRLAARAAALPGVESAAVTTASPAQQPRMADVEAATPARAAVHAVSSGYFATLDVPVIAGRPLVTADRAGTEPVVVISETLARRLWPRGDALGSRLTVSQPQPGAPPQRVDRVVVGVVGDVRQGFADADLADVYVPLAQAPQRFATVLVRTMGDPGAQAQAVRGALSEVDPELAADRVQPLDAEVGALTARPRFLASLLSAFAIVAALLSLAGMYGVIAYAVRQREREVAVRLAVGASAGAIQRLFLRQGGVLLAVGLAAGLIAASLATRLIESELFGITPRDPLALGGATAAFALCGLAATWWPARRATRIDPVLALRGE